MAAPALPTETPPKPDAPQRIMAIDAFRGFVMLAMVSSGFGFAQILKEHPELSSSPLWRTLAYQFSHVPWVGCAFWDLIQPAFMFLVGTSLAYSLANRSSRGQSTGWLIGHALFRAAALVLLGVFLRSNGKPQTFWTFMDVTSQIGLGYLPLFACGFLSQRARLGVAGLVLAATWVLYASYPAPPSNFDYAAVGVGGNVEKFESGASAHFNMNANVGTAIDREVLNWFPREKPYQFDAGGYQTINFLPSLATMIFGLCAGELLRGEGAGRTKFWTLIAAGLVALAVGLALHAGGVCPIVKKIWTPSWAIFSTGVVLLLLAAFYGVIELGGFRAWSYPFRVVGMNSIAIYCLEKLTRGWILATIATHLGAGVFKYYRPEYAFEPLVKSLVVMYVLWLVCDWMYRRKLFLKL